ncbi:MAG TPA: isocitrate lyase/phosphoenolpyruvate mutase family protein [Candidatus Binatia bacterium]|jgi:2-methylisocitrate lyase-like PEP mutase family enzyme|nr:isocitrate lyase/phosphoenolpyruvate mutase family protein [Candidatus Binatia bacterium]
MADPAQVAKAERFRALHARGSFLRLPNAWDVITARVFEDCGFTAIGTTSFGIARAHGYQDGHNDALDCSLAMVRRMASALAVPLTADIEAGYGATPEAVERTGRAFVDAGAVGLNVEDGDGSGGLADIALQVERIAALRAAGDAAGVPVFINARTDAYWLDVGLDGARFDLAVARADAYRRAGADGIFVPGLNDPEQLARLVRAVDAPLNVLAGPCTPPIPELIRIGVRRLSLGSGPMRATLGLLRAIGRDLLDRDRASPQAAAIPYDEANAL